MSNNNDTNMDITAKQSDFAHHARVDRIGIIASILCAIHCALTPILLILLPTFGEKWAHPSTHWIMAIVVIPIAIFMMIKRYKKHAKKWVLLLGSTGVLLITVGAILPYLETTTSNQKTLPPGATSATITTCTDNCCPSIVTNELGKKSLHIPPASIVTTLGGLCLIAVHATNLCRFKSCKCCKKTTPAPAV